jgi:micrococcal nuclease
MIPALLALVACLRLPASDSDSAAESSGTFDPAALPSGPSPCRNPLFVQVLDTKDGDTLAVVDEADVEIDVRLIGADAPEIDHGSEPAECWGTEAAEFTATALLGKQVWLTFDQECVDLYARSLAYVHLGAGADDFFNARLLREGHATVLPIPPNNTFADSFLEAQVEARGAGRGMWGACL